MFDPTMLAQGGDILSKVGSFIAAGKKADSDRKWQAYNNKMTKLQDANNQNGLTVNENMRKERKQAQLIQIQKSAIATRASAEVQAAASGTIGNSVNAVLLDYSRNANNAIKAVERDDHYQDMGTDNQRMQSALQTKMALDLSYIPSPNPATMFLGISKALMPTT